MVCDEWFKGGMGKPSHYRGKKHKENIVKLKQKVREANAK